MRGSAANSSINLPSRSSIALALSWTSCTVFQRHCCTGCSFSTGWRHDCEPHRGDPDHRRRPDRRRAQGRPHPRAAQAAGRPRRVRRQQRPVPGDRDGRHRLRRRQRDPDRELLPARARHGARGLPRPGDRHPRLQVLRAALRQRPVRLHRRGHPRQPGARPPPPARRRGRRPRARGPRRRQVHRARPRGRRHDPRGAARRHRRARHGPDSPPSRRTARPATRWSTARRYTGPYLPGYVAREHHGRPPRGPPEAAVPGHRPLRRQRRARPDGRVGGVLQQGHGLHEHGRVHRRRHRHRLLRADVARSSRAATTG